MNVLCFFFKQKTAYEVRISDWSSDVCSSDLRDLLADAVDRAIGAGGHRIARCRHVRCDEEDLILLDVAAVPARKHGARERAAANNRDRKSDGEGKGVQYVSITVDTVPLTKQQQLR